ncbi:MAG: TraB/GumN family protein [Treponema sp.]|nr:TraB/GumN family protein [Treponema sp.]
MKINSLKKILILAAAAVFFFSCASNKVETNISEPKAVVEKTENNMLWKISGLDANGAPSTVYVFGVVNVGDERLYPLAEPVQEALGASNRFVCEMNPETMQDFVLKLTQEIENSVIESDGHSLADDLTDEELECVLHFFGMENTATFASYKPWVLDLSMTGLLISEKVSAEYGAGLVLTNELAQMGVPLESLDTAEAQISVLAYGDWAFQMYNLKQTIKNIFEYNPLEDKSAAMYEAYLADDTEYLKKEFALDLSEIPEEIQLAYTAHYKLSVTDRVRDWATKIENYLSEGGTTFVFGSVGLFICDNSVFDVMRADNIIE